MTKISEAAWLMATAAWGVLILTVWKDSDDLGGVCIALWITAIALLIRDGARARRDRKHSVIKAGMAPTMALERYLGQYGQTTSIQTSGVDPEIIRANGKVYDVEPHGRGVQVQLENNETRKGAFGVMRDPKSVRNAKKLVRGDDVVFVGRTSYSQPTWVVLDPAVLEIAGDFYMAEGIK